MLKRIAVLMIYLLIAVFVFPVQAKTASKELPMEVYITKRGLRFYPQECAAIAAKETKKISLEEAEEKGIKPSEECYSGEQIEAYNAEVKKIKGIRKGKAVHKQVQYYK